eukprot:gene9449-11060_t
MNLKFKIFQWVDEVLHPKALINNEINKEDLVKLENGFLNQLKNYAELAFSGTVLSRRHTAVHLRLLVNLSNTIYGIKNAPYALSFFRFENGNEDNYQKLFKHLKTVSHRKKIIDYTWNLSRQIANLELADTSDLIDILFINEFNSRIFFDFYSNELNSKLKDIPNLHDQLLTIIAEQDRFSGLAGSTIKIVVSQDEQFSKSTHRLKIFLSVAQLGLFIRLFVEKGLLAKENIGDQFTFFASHFSTPQAPFISAESLRKKSTDVEFATAQKLKAHLIGMLNWLNENYNLSNFKGS